MNTQRKRMRKHFISYEIGGLLLPDTKPFCKRCLLSEMPDEASLYEIIADYLQALPPEQKADDSLYQQRLVRCRTCDQLINGTCLLCGCYVETRAAKGIQCCPHTPPYW